MINETQAVAEHKWYLSEKLGRDVGFEVAAADYRAYVKADATPESYGAVTNWIFRTLERLAAKQGIRALVQANLSARHLPVRNSL